jgi:hypothetical protein
MSAYRDASDGSTHGEGDHRPFRYDEMVKGREKSALDPMTAALQAVAEAARSVEADKFRAVVNGVAAELRRLADELDGRSPDDGTS